jgi:hypothetical protein
MIDPTNMAKIRFLGDNIQIMIKYAIEILESHHYFNKDQGMLVVDLNNQMAKTGMTISKLLGSNHEEFKRKAEANPSEDYP